MNAITTSLLMLAAREIERLTDQVVTGIKFDGSNHEFRYQVDNVDIWRCTDLGEEFIEGVVGRREGLRKALEGSDVSQMVRAFKTTLFSLSIKMVDYFDVIIGNVAKGRDIQE
jgi:hypothetical protein